MDKMDVIRINKNRGWRGLAEAIITNFETKERMTMIFSFSPDVWRDMLEGKMVFQDEQNYYVICFDTTIGLPSPTQQRSVLIKNFTGNVTDLFTYEKINWMSEAPREHFRCIDHFRRNRNNHTQSDWNCIGIRVTPSI